MKKNILDKVQERLAKLKELKKQVEETKKHIREKGKEISDFKSQWKDNCKHVFYRVLRREMGILYTEGYHCCLCDYFRPKTSQDTEEGAPYHSGINSGRFIHKRQDGEEEIYDFIGTYNKDEFFLGTRKEREGLGEPFPIPPEYQAEVDKKRSELNKLISEQEALEEGLKKLEATVKTIEQELKKVTHILNDYFKYPETVCLPPVHWTPDDFNYDY